MLVCVYDNGVINADHNDDVAMCYCTLALQYTNQYIIVATQQRNYVDVDMTLHRPLQSTITYYPLCCWIGLVIDAMNGSIISLISQMRCLIYTMVNNTLGCDIQYYVT